MNERLTYLFQALYENRISPAEREEFNLLVQDPVHASAIREQIQQTYTEPALEVLPEQRSMEILQAILQSGSAETALVKRLPQRKWYRIAAAVVLILGATTWLLVNRSRDTTRQTTVQQIPDIAPGKDGALLTLSDGSTVLMDSIQNGIVSNEGGATVSVVNGSLQYQGAGAETVYNSMSTPKGRQYQFSLPDGSKVWLNAASSIRYPVAFNDKERKVEVSGEVYFEVTHRPRQPFIVSVDQRAQVEVLGTHFNVKAYRNEAGITTTLIEGSVRVSNKETASKVLTPGQQAAIGQTIIVSNANIEGVTAWKNGSFYFTQMDFTEVMRQIERWYDVEVVYEAGVPDVQLFGGVKRNLSLDGIIRGLKDMGINLRLEQERKLVVTAQ